MSHGASGQRGGIDGGVVEARTQDRPQLLAEPGRLRLRVPGQSGGLGHAGPIIHREDGAVHGRPETRKHIAEDHQRDARRRRLVQMFHPELEEPS